MPPPRRGKGKKTNKKTQNHHHKKIQPWLRKTCPKLQKMQQFADMEWKIVGYWRLVESNAPEKERNSWERALTALFSSTCAPFSVFLWVSSYAERL